MHETLHAGFEYDRSKDDLLEVHSNGFLERSSTPIQKWKDGNTTITFSRPGAFFYTCSLLHHHLAGQFLMVIVSEDTIPSEPSSEAPIESPLAIRSVDEAAQPDSSLKRDPTSVTGEATNTAENHRATEDLKPAPQASPTTSATTSKEVKPAEQNEVKTDHAQSPATTQTEAGHSDSKKKQEVQSGGSTGQHSANHPSSSADDNDLGKAKTTPQHTGENQAKTPGSVHGWPPAMHTNGTNGPQEKSSAAAHGGPTSGSTNGADSGLQAKPKVAARGGPTAGHTTGGDESLEKSAAASHGGPTAGHTTGGDGPNSRSSAAMHGWPAAEHSRAGEDELQAKPSVDQHNTGDEHRQANGSADPNAN